MSRILTYADRVAAAIPEEYYERDVVGLFRKQAGEGSLNAQAALIAQTNNDDTRLPVLLLVVLLAKTVRGNDDALLTLDQRDNLVV